MGTRLEVPSMVAWNKSFAIAIKSDVNGSVLASPSEGYITLKPEQHDKTSFPKELKYC